MKMKIKKPLELNVVGIAVQLVEQPDSTSVSDELAEYIKDCGFQPLQNIFKDDIYTKENFEYLFSMDSIFVSQQPGMSNMKHLLVCKLEFVLKTDDQTKKDKAWITFLGRWMMLKPLKKVHDFYYLESISYTGEPEDKVQLISFLLAQMHLKFCMDIKKYVSNHE